MAVRPFVQWLGSAGVDFGLPAEVLQAVARHTRAGHDLYSLAADAVVRAAGPSDEHLLRLRRAVRRHRALQRAAEGLAAPPIGSWIELHAWRWALQADCDAEQQRALAAALSALAAACLERGRLRLHLRRADDPRAAELAELAEHSEGCAELPPHRWFKISRALDDGLLWVELLCPEGEAARLAPAAAGAERIRRLERAAAGPVLAAIAARAERESIAGAAAGMRSLLGRAPIAGPVGGLVEHRGRLGAAVVSDSDSARHADFAAGQLDRAAAWLAAAGVQLVALARPGGRGRGAGAAVRALAAGGLEAEPVREAALLRQARRLAQPLAPAAAEVAARRLKDPVAGFADLEPDALGLGEYLDRVDAEQLRGALADARAAAERDRAGAPARSAGLERGLQAGALVRGMADLRPGLELTGKVVNLTHFGAFVELGLEQQGLIHLSELAERHVRHPSEVLAVGQTVRVRVLEVDAERGRIGLSLRGDRSSRRRGGPSKRGHAIAALDALFKK
jgi:predicted RNA-binding protein with RPS1 domain